MGVENIPVQSIQSTPDKSDPGESIQTRGGLLAAHVVKSLDAVSGISTNPKNPEKSPEEVLTLKEQLDIILAFRDLYFDAPKEKQAEIWNAYIECIDASRKAAFDLPPAKDASSYYKNLIGPAMTRKDSFALLNIFAKEKVNKNESWEELKDTPGINFVAGIAGGAGEFAGAIGNVLLTAETAYGVRVSVTKEQREQAQQVMKEMGKSLFDLTEVAKGVARVQEYEDTMKDGKKVGYILGKHYFDVATALLTLGGSGAFARATTLAKEAALKTGETLSRAAEKGAEFSLKKAASVAGLEIAENVAEESIEQTAKKHSRDNG